MIQVLTGLLVAMVSLTIAAAAAYILGFLISMFVTMFTAPADALTHHHHRPVAG